tara:strand:- start:1249 stop:1839 length:591 start_codon:yes stop_codon:yes gene_type:complete
MIQRKKNRLLVQFTLFLLTVLIIYFIYGTNNNTSTKNEVENKIVKNNQQEETNSNYFEDVEYTGIDLNGNRYILQSGEASFDIDKPELIKMKIMIAKFYLKDGTILTVSGDTGSYNNQTYDMKFINNIEAKHNNDFLFGDNLDFFNSKGLLTIYGNVKSDSIKGNIVADMLKFDLNKKTLDASMFSNKQVQLGLNN